MTNREWLNSLCDEKLAEKLLPPTNCECGNCIIHAECTHIWGNCYDRIVEWLKYKHKKPMPEIKIGDVIYCKTGKSLEKFVVLSNIHANNLNGITIRLRAINNIWKIARMDDEKGLLIEIWRADDE